MAGLANQGFSAKSYRPTGATVAIEQGLDPDSVSKGRWKSKETFEYHYVHAKPDKNFVSKIYGLSKCESLYYGIKEYFKIKMALLLVT